MTIDRPVVVALGPVDPALVTGVLGDEIVFVADPSEQHIASAVGAIVRADAVVDAAFLVAPRGCASSHALVSASTTSISKRPPHGASRS